MKLKSFVFRIIQKCLLHTSYLFCKICIKKSNGNLWVIGVDETASVLHHLGQTITPAVTVNLSKHSLYSFQYDIAIDHHPGKIHNLIRLVLGPLYLGFLAHKATHFLYIWQTGFLNDIGDGRAYEFSFLKKRGRKVVCFFLGSDIRSHALLLNYANQQNRDVISTYMNQVHPDCLSTQYDARMRLNAAAADKFADIIFTAPVDQMSYIQKRTYGFFYTFPVEQILMQTNKFENMSPVRIVHAPSSPIIKGTPLVRAAVKALREEGYLFEYLELTGMKHELVMQELAKAHIVLNQFYAFVPGVLGIEAMANCCAMMCSANPEVEDSLPAGVEQAWYRTEYWQITDNLRYLLDNPDKIIFYAYNGRDFVKDNYTYEKANEQFMKIMKENNLLNSLN